MPDWQAAARLDAVRGRAVSSPPRYAPVAQLDRVLPSEGRGQRFESSRARHFQTVHTGHMVYTCTGAKGLGAGSARPSWWSRNPSLSVVFALLPQAASPSTLA